LLYTAREKRHQNNLKGVEPEIGKFTISKLNQTKRKVIFLVVPLPHDAFELFD
jgi:hypothetical protein